MLRDIDSYIAGINAYLAATHSTERSVDPQRRLLRERPQGPVPRPGRRPRGAELRVPQRAPAAARQGQGFQAFNDLRQFKNPTQRHLDQRDVPVRAHPAGSIPAAWCSTTTASRRRPPPRRASRGSTATKPVQASNELMVTGRHSTTEHPILVGGPQISYFFPGLVLEMDMHAPGLQLARRHLGPVPGLPADRPHDRASRPRSPRRAATSSTSTPRRSAAAAPRSTCTRASAATWATSTPAR